MSNLNKISLGFDILFPNRVTQQRKVRQKESKISLGFDILFPKATKEREAPFFGLNHSGRILRLDKEDQAKVRKRGER